MGVRVNILWIAKTNGFCRALMLAAPLWILNCPKVTSGAFTQPSGQGLIIATASFTTSGQGFDNKGFPGLTARTQKRELSLYGEYGITDWLTGIGQTTAASRSLSGIVSDHFTGLDYTAAGLRAKVATLGRFVLSVEGNLRIPGASDGKRPAQAGHTGFESDLRIQAGVNFDLWSWASFADASVGYRMRSGDPASEYRGDFTFGTRPKERWLWLLQSFNTMSEGKGRNGFPAQREHKLQSSVVYDINKAWSVQLGAVSTLAGKNTTRDMGGFVSIWRRF